MSGKSNPRRAPETRVEGISSISVCGFKSISRRQEVEVRPLTILAGANSSGKSSAVQPLLLLKQTLESTFDPGALLLNGPNVRLTSTIQALYCGPGEKAARLEVGLALHNGHSLFIRFKSQPRAGPVLDTMSTGKDEKAISLREGMSQDEILAILPEWAKGMRDLMEQRDKGKAAWAVGRHRCFLEPCLVTNLDGGEPRIFMGFQELTHRSEFEDHIRKVIHVPALRGNPERAYQTTAVGEVFPGTFESYVASVIAHWQATRDGRAKELGRSLEKLGLTWKVAAKRIDETQVELRVGRLTHGTRGNAQDMVNIADVGFGVSQTLPVVVALLAASPGQFVHIEQPEIHLHPRAQTRLAELLAAAAARGVRVVVETHSSLLLLAVQTLVAEGKLSTDLVKLHWFTRDKDGATTVSSCDLDKAGAFGDWPEDFGDVELKAESRFLDASEKRLMEK